jgi:predicted nucleic acid-binding protein
VSALIIDASVVVKWFISESGSQQAVALLSVELVAPQLLVAECANALWHKVRRGEISAEEATLAAKLLAASEITLLPMQMLVRSALSIAMELGHPAYDCFYVAAAESIQAPLVTADQRFLRRVQDRAGVTALGLADAAARFGAA